MRNSSSESRISKEQEEPSALLDEVILPVPKDCPKVARIAEVTIGNDLTTATLRILADTAEILVTLEDRDVEYTRKCTSLRLPRTCLISDQAFTNNHAIGKRALQYNIHRRKQNENDTDLLQEPYGNPQ